MYSSIQPVTPAMTSTLASFLQRQEIWNMIPLDALYVYGLHHPDHQWYVELKENRVEGVIYSNQQLLHLAYPTVPSPRSYLYQFIPSKLPQFITHGNSEILEPMIKRLKGYDVVCLAQSEYVVQSKRTIDIVFRSTPGFTGTGIQIRLAKPSDYHELLRLYTGTEIESSIDAQLLSVLIQLKRVLIATKENVIIGSIMRLKESKNFCLLGGLFVRSTYRKHGIATLLGQVCVQRVLREGKQICFYYDKNQPHLIDFYQKLQLNPIGRWGSYSATSNATT